MHQLKDFSFRSGDLATFPTLCATREPECGWASVPVFCSSSKKCCFYLSVSWVTWCTHTVLLQPLSPKQSHCIHISLNPDSANRHSLGRETKLSVGLGTSAPSRQPALLSKNQGCSMTCNKDRIAQVSWNGCLKPTGFGWLLCWYHPSHLQYCWCYCKCCSVTEGIAPTVSYWELSTR